MNRTWSGVFLVVAAALVVLVGFDTAARRVVPPVNRREAEDGLRDLANSNPDVVVLGSSHARTLHVVGQELSRRTHGSRNLVAIPLENGKITVYDWTLRHRIAPLLEQTDEQGKLVRGRVKEFMLIIEWWDSCMPSTTERYAYWNLPSRAWGFDDFVADVAESGLTGYNRNYLQNRLRRLFSESGLVYDRLNQQLVQKTMDHLRGRPLERTPEMEQKEVLRWQGMVESGVQCIGAPSEVQALRNVLSYAQSRGFETSILLFPRKPATITEQAKNTTLRRFAALVRDIAGPSVRVVDLTTTSPLRDADFMADFDHVNAEGNKKFAQWALDHDLSFLQSNGHERTARLGQERSVQR